MEKCALIEERLLAPPISPAHFSFQLFQNLIHSREGQKPQQQQPSSNWISISILVKRMRLTASIKSRKEVCAYKKVCAYRKGALNNPSLRYLGITEKLVHKISPVLKGRLILYLRTKNQHNNYYDKFFTDESRS